MLKRIKNYFKKNYKEMVILLITILLLKFAIILGYGLITGFIIGNIYVLTLRYFGGN